VHQLLDEVQAKRETVVITKRGKPVAKLVPVEEQADDLFGFLRKGHHRWRRGFARTQVGKVG